MSTEVSKELLSDPEVERTLADLKEVINHAGDIVAAGDNLKTKLFEAYSSLRYAIKQFEERVNGPQPLPLPLPPEQMAALFDWLGDKACDTTLHHTMTFMHDHDLPMEQGLALKAYLQHYGGYCDCEVLMNVMPHVLPENRT
jgi:hypothetical protein